MTPPLQAEPDWYGILGVDPSATDAQIGRAFRALARRYHPDVGPDASDGAFSDVARAWEVLGDRSRRADYDLARSGGPRSGIRIPVRRWAAAPTGSTAVDPSPEGLDGSRQEVEVPVSLADSVTGMLAKVDLPGAALCGACSGTGRCSGGVCSACAGDGRSRRQSGSITINRICPDCGGTGARPARRCDECAGRGWTEHARTLSVRIPPGVADGTKLRLRSASGETAGYARVRLAPDPWFSREGADLVLRLPLNVAEAALGATIAVSLPDGPAEIRVPPGTRPGERLRHPGRGVPGTRRGDLIAVVEVVIPQDPSEAERTALEALAAVTPNVRADWPAAPATGSSGGSSTGNRTGTQDHFGSES